MEFVTFRKFLEQERVEAFIEILNANNIDYQIVEDRDSLDSLYGGKLENRVFFVKIKQQDFTKAETILLELGKRELDTVDKDHYLFSFTDEELFEILSKPDEWSEFDYQLANKLLKERGKEITSETTDLLRKQRIKDLSKPEEGSKGWIYVGYIFSMFGGLLGIFMGLIIITSKKVVPNGQKVYTYSAIDRKHGLRIFIIGIVMFIVLMVIQIMNSEY